MAVTARAGEPFTLALSPDQYAALAAARRVYLLLWPAGLDADGRTAKPPRLVVTAMAHDAPGRSWPADHRDTPATLIVPPAR